MISISQRELNKIYPKPGWVEHEPMEIWESQYSALVEAITQAAIHADQMTGIGITNQRETVIVWDKDTGTPIYNSIFWQCRRTAVLP